VARLGEIKFEVKPANWQVVGTIKPKPFQDFWSENFGNQGTICFDIECPEQIPETAGGITIRVHGCGDTFAEFFIVPVPKV
jgi:hypothetical protein